MRYCYVPIFFALLVSFASPERAFSQGCCCVSCPTVCVLFIGIDCNFSCLSLANCPVGVDAGAACDAACTGLPVEMVSFTAVTEGLNVMLNWETASETANVGFFVELAVGSEIFEQVAFVEGAGTTIAPHSYGYLVEALDPGHHVFRLKQVDLDGTFEYSETVEATVTIPGEFVLEPAYPNPFNPSTTVRFAVAQEQAVRVVLYDATGKLVRSLYEGTVASNDMQTVNVSATGLATGVYIVRIEGNRFVASQEIVFVK